MWYPNMLSRVSAPAKFWLVLAGFALVDCLSMLGWGWPVAGSVLAVALAVLWLVLAARNLPLAVVLLVVELILGSFGYLLSFELGTTRLSLRLLLFVAAFAVMLYRLASNRHHVVFSHPWIGWFVGALATLAWAAGSGYYHWNSLANLALDANGYLYLLLLPLFVEAVALAGRERLLWYARLLLVPAVVWLTLRTLGLLYLFTHLPAGSLTWVYQWYRDSGLGEITSAGGGFFRVFSQSHLYSGLAAVVGFGWLWHRLAAGRYTMRDILLPTAYSLLPTIALVASLSRSLWLGVAAAWLITPLLAWRSIKFGSWARYVLVTFVLLAASAGAVLMVARLPWPLAPLGAAG
ncbi:MAG: hypothetical protein U1C53_02175, partial [Candidatus Veblenbacteria bacterium]|nr:hypothetical protein [Candidatus Veblenbacteria bacterium]